MDKSNIAQLTILQIYLLVLYTRFLVRVPRFYGLLTFYKTARKYSFRILLTRFHFTVWVDWVACDEYAEAETGD